MQHYKDPSNQLWALSEDDITQGYENRLPRGSIKITDAEAETHREQARLEALTSEAVKAFRGALLNKCDWTQLPDVPQATRDKWQEYRQALRDIPAQTGFPKAVNWPTSPAKN